MELKIHWPHLNLHPRTNPCPDPKNEQNPTYETKRRGSLGFGEVDFSEQLHRQQETEQKVRKAAVGSFLLGTAACVAAGISTAAGITASAIVSGGASLVFMIGGIGAFVFNHLEKKSHTPPTNFMGLGQREHGAPELNTMAPNHSVIVAENGEESTFWKGEFLKHAKQSIEISGNFCGGEAFREALRNIRSNMRQNVQLKVHLISSRDLLKHEDIQLMKELSKEFPERFQLLISDRKFEFFPRVHCHENHAKLVIVDEKLIVMGGTNFKDTFGKKVDGTEKFDRPKIKNPIDVLKTLFTVDFWRDNDIVVKGDIAKTLRLEFFKLFAIYSYKMKSNKFLVNRYFPIDPNRPIAQVPSFENHEKKIDNVSIKAVVGSPRSSENGITEEYCRLLNQTKKWEEVWIGNLLFNPTSKLYQAISNTVERGTNVKVVTNGISNATPMSHFFIWPNRLRYYSLMKKAPKNNVKFYEFVKVPGAMYHSKTSVIGSKSIFSSYNLGKKSHYSDDELALVVESEKVASVVRNILRKDIQLSHKVTEAQAKKWRGPFGIIGRFENAVSARFAG